MREDGFTESSPVFRTCGAAAHLRISAHRSRAWVSDTVQLHFGQLVFAVVGGTQTQELMAIAKTTVVTVGKDNKPLRNSPLEGLF
mgnify:CR=1 FL=1